MPTLTFEAARECVIEKVRRHRTRPYTETVTLADAAGRILSEPVFADRDCPATARSIRDGYAVRVADTPGRLRVAGEVRAGETYAGTVAAGECVAIMTGAPVPEGADAIVMIEHTQRDGDFVSVPEAPPAQFINPRGAEARAGELLLGPGRRIGAAEVALLASVGNAEPAVFALPRVAVLPTGDEVVESDATPLPHQVRNSNAHALAAQVRAAGGAPVLLPVAPDSLEPTRALIERALDCDLLLLSGGVSAGKYDVVEQALAALGAGFYFDRVLIQPGQPLVFGRVGRTFFFGLPGNPASTLVTFEIFARAALELLGGASDTALPLALARLTECFRHRPGLTRFLPARLNGIDITPVPWRGSSDIPAMARANALLVADADRDCWDAGDLIRVLQK